MEKTVREHWGSRVGFVLAIAGSAVGLGNFWKFPYITGLNGGGAFVLVYLLCILICGMPVMLCEIAIGRAAARNPVDAFAYLERRTSRISRWIGVLLAAGGFCMAFSNPVPGIVLAALGLLFAKYGFAVVGMTTIVTALLILSYYSVIGGWIIKYAILGFSGDLHVADTESASAVFSNFTSDSFQVSVFHFIFLGLCALMLIGGIRKGIERFSKILMPLMLGIILVMLVRSLTLPGAMKGVSFYLTPDFSALNTGSLLEALGHSFYTLSLAMAITITYGSYLKKDENLFSASIWVIIFDTVAALLAGLVIFPAVFAMGFAPDAGPSLIFKIIPATFEKIPGGFGWLWTGLFFVMFAIAAITSGASLLETGVTFLMDKTRMSRVWCVTILYIGIGSLGLLSAVSINDWQNLQSVYDYFGVTFFPESGSWFDMLDKLTSNWMLPLGGLFTAIFAGWVWGTCAAGREIRRGAESFADNNLVTYLSGFNGEKMYKTTANHGLTLMTLWALTVRYVAPVIIFIVFLKAIGVNVGV